MQQGFPDNGAGGGGRTRTLSPGLDFECLHEFRQRLPENIRYAGADGSLFPLKNKRLMGLLLPKYPFVLLP